MPSTSLSQGVAYICVGVGSTKFWYFRQPSQAGLEWHVIKKKMLYRCECDQSLLDQPSIEAAPLILF